MTCTDFLVKKTEFTTSNVYESPLPEILADNQVLLKIDKFAFTANNVGYAVSGEFIGYWKLFPTQDDSWGRIPVWGFADVIKSNNPDIKEGERFYGFYPMSSHLIVDAGKVSEGGFMDVVEHRQNLPPLYNQYSKVVSGSEDAALEDERMILYPLFATGFVLQDFLDDHDYFDADTIIVGSASSKTGIGLGQMLNRYSKGKVKALGLTSKRNKEFVENLGCYDSVVTYDEINSIPTDKRYAYIDMSGDSGVMSDLHHHLKDQLQCTFVVGATHWDKSDVTSEKEALPGPKPKFFFAPAHIGKRVEEWGAEEFERKGYNYWKELAGDSSWLNVVEGKGKTEVESWYKNFLKGGVPASTGISLSL